MLKSRSEAMAACGFRDKRGIVVDARQSILAETTKSHVRILILQDRSTGEDYMGLIMYSLSTTHTCRLKISIAAQPTKEHKSLNSG